MRQHILPDLPMPRCFVEALIFSLLVCGAMAPQARAVTISDDVWRIENGVLVGENVFVLNDGIPIAGNGLDPELGLQQVRYEGRVDDKGNLDPSDDENINFDIIVGRTGKGTLTLGSDTLRDQHLIIGDEGMLHGFPSPGNGTVRIDGVGALYNNNPFIVPFIADPDPNDPPNFPDGDPDAPLSPSVNPRPLDVGFDLIVGRAGDGELTISTTGVAEIQDAVVVGDQSNAIGTLTVDGIGSFLGSGGFMAEEQGGGVFEPHQMIIGRLGDGTMRITNGGAVRAIGPRTAGGASRVIAAVIGSDRPFDDREVPRLGGTGRVEVDGPGSRWILGGTLQIGGYHNAEDAINGGEDDFEGNDALYPRDSKLATLVVRDGGLVKVIPQPTIEGGQQPNELDIVIGRFGTLELDGGTVEIQPPTTTDGENTTIDENRFRIINDGVIHGHGTVSIGQFRNRAQGRVIVGPGEKLLVHSSARFAPGANSDDELPLRNYGLIEVVGTPDERAELHISRAIQPEEPGAFTPFLNLRAVPRGVPVPPDRGRSDGLIQVEHGTIRFDSDMENRGVFSFTGGSNIVTGDVTNKATSMPGSSFDEGTFTVGGLSSGVGIPGTGSNVQVTIQNSFTNEGIPGPGDAIFEICATCFLQVLEGRTFTNSGLIRIGLSGNSASPQFSQIASTGSAVISGDLEVNITGVGSTFGAGDVFSILTSTNLTGNFDSVSINGFLGPNLSMFTFPFQNNVNLIVFDFSAASGADFDGDGVVDLVDLEIWRQNLGGSGPIGDANGDGIVDGRDFFIWQQQASGFPGSGSGFGFAQGTVPEPATAVMMLVGALLALATRRRR